MAEADGNQPRQTICLCMIVKNEAPVIARCLASVRPVIDHWLIVDTGSTDGTQRLIREALGDLPGKLIERPWRDFASNRTEALDLARARGDYSLVIDADDTLEPAPDFRMPPLCAGAYTLAIADGGVTYERMQLVANHLPWRYEGVLHEYLTCEGNPDRAVLPGLVMRRNHDGARRRDPETYRRDAALLEAALLAEKRPFLLARYRFYLAQSYRDCNDPSRALEQYVARARMGFWDEEVYVSLLQAARLKEQLAYSEQDVIDTYLAAIDAQPARAEAFHGVARYCRLIGRNLQGFELSERAIGIAAPPAAALFVEPWIYEYGLLDEYAVNAYWIGRHRESLDACVKLLTSGTVPRGELERVAANARFALESLPQSPDFGARGAASFADQHADIAPRDMRTIQLEDDAPTITIAILAKQKERALGLYLDCIEALDYPKSRISLHIRTNNNRDRTEAILRDWIARVGGLYARVEFDASDVSQPVERFGVHEWNPERFSVLGKIRDASLAAALEQGSEFYFVADVDNFIKPSTLRELVALNLPIVAPLLRAVAPGAVYSNFHAEIDDNGYYAACDQYGLILERRVVGVFEVPVVHCSYLIRADVIPDLTYDDGSERYEYVIFADSARKSRIPQYLDNRQIYGYITFEDGSQAARDMFGENAEAQVESARALLRGGGGKLV